MTTTSSGSFPHARARAPGRQLWPRPGRWPGRPRTRPPTEQIVAALILAALAAWAAAPVVYLLIRAAVRGETFTGGASPFPGDQLQYMAWIRGAGEHGLAADGFALRVGAHVYLDPMFLLSGGLWRAGLGIAASYLIWLPVAVGVLFIGARRYVHATIDGAGARTAALILALFFVNPVSALAGWTGGPAGLTTAGGELALTAQLLGYFPAVISVGLMAMLVLWLEPIVDRRARAGGRGQGWYLAWSSVAGALTSWVHPWQGETLLVLVAIVIAVQRLERRCWPLLVPALATVAPLVYYFALPRIDGAWVVAGQATTGRIGILSLVLALAPLAAFAVPGIRAARERGRTPALALPRPPVLELTLLLWPVAALIVYFGAGDYPRHALTGMSLPLAVLAVRGWRRLALPRWLAVPAIVLATVPGLVYLGQQFQQAVAANRDGMLLSADEARALSYLERAPAPGGVLASPRLSTAVPAYTGRRTWSGHPSWTPDYYVRTAQVRTLLDGRMSATAARAFLRGVGARYLLVDCAPRFDAPQQLGALVTSTRAFGCVTVYRLDVPNRAAAF